MSSAWRDDSRGTHCSNPFSATGGHTNPITATTGTPIQRGSHLTPRWRRQSRANSSLKLNSLLAGKIQAILFVWAPEYRRRLEIQHRIQWLVTQFPTQRNKEFILA
jgi:hypothetical protein